MRENLTHTIEDYLKAIFEITQSNKRASTNQIAAQLGVKPASVTGMIKKLAQTDPPLLEYQSHQGVLLTSEGEKIALEIIRHHRLLELFLHQILGYEWDQVHDEADRLEHVISEEFEERIAEALGHPRHDPHGDPIPNRDLTLPERSTMSLSDMRPGQKVIIMQVNNEDPDLLRYLSDCGITPNTDLIVKQFSHYDENLSLQISGQDELVVLGPKITRDIYVQLLHEKQSRQN